MDTKVLEEMGFDLTDPDGLDNVIHTLTPGAQHGTVQAIPDEMARLCEEAESLHT